MEGLTQAVNLQLDKAEKARRASPVLCRLTLGTLRADPGRYYWGKLARKLITVCDRTRTARADHAATMTSVTAVRITTGPLSRPKLKSDSLLAC